MAKEIINFEWCEKHGFKNPGMNVTTDSLMYYVKDRYYLVGYTERTTGEKQLFVQNPETKKSIEMTMPKFDFKQNVKNDFTTDCLEMMCDMVGLFYPFEKDY